MIASAVGAGTEAVVGAASAGASAVGAAGAEVGAGALSASTGAVGALGVGIPAAGVVGAALGAAVALSIGIERSRARQTPAEAVQTPAVRHNRPPPVTHPPRVCSHSFAHIQLVAL